MSETYIDYKFNHIDPNTGDVVPFNDLKEVQKWKDDNGYQHDTRLSEGAMNKGASDQLYRFIREQTEKMYDEALTYNDLGCYTVCIMWLEVLHLFQDGEKRSYDKIGEIDPFEHKEYLMEIMGKRFALAILSERMAKNTNLDPDIKGLHTEIASGFESVTNTKLKYTALQKILRNPMDSNIKLEKRLVVLGYVMRHLFRDVTNVRIGYSLQKLDTYYQETAKKHFISILK
jgi:hypothetical protein